MPPAHDMITLNPPDKARQENPAMAGELQKPPQPETPQPFMEEVHLQDYLNVIYRRRKTFLAAFTAVFAGVALYTFTMEPLYEAAATLHVKDDKARSEVLDVLAISSGNPVEAELEILKSRTNAEQVVRQLHLDWKVSDRSTGFTCRMLEVSSTAAHPEYLVELTGSGTYVVKDGNGEVIGHGQAGRRMTGGGLTLLLSDLAGRKGDSFRLALLPFNNTVEAVRRNVKAVEVGKKTSILSVSCRDTDPEKAKNVVNALVQAYLEQSVGFKTEEASRTVGFVENQLQGLRSELEGAEKNLENYKSAAGVVKLDSTAERLIGKLSETEKELAGIAIQKKGVEFALASLREARRRGATYSPAITRDDPLVAGMAGRLAELEVQKRAMATDSTENHPAMKAVKAQIDELQKKIQATYENGMRNLAKQEGDVRQQLGRYEGVLKSLPAAERDLARLTRVSKVNGDIYTFLLQKHEEARIAKASTISNIDIVDPAITPERPVKPQKGKNLLLGLLVGSMLGVGLSFFREYLDDTIKDTEGAKRELKWPVLAVTPHIRLQVQDEPRKSISLFTYLEPKSQVAEAFRCLRTGIHFSAVNRKRQVILVTSTFPGEGKSTISSNLACIAAQTGALVVLVDCDLRRSSLHEKMCCSRKPGLTNYLAGDASLEKVVQQTEVPNLDFISAGITPPNPSELLGSQQMVELVGSLREIYDTVIIDAPPALAVTDAPLLACRADMVMVVVEAGRVPVRAARQMRETLASVNAPVAGMVFNDKTGKGKELYGYGYYGYYDYYAEEDMASIEHKPIWTRVADRLTGNGKQAV